MLLRRLLATTAVVALTASAVVLTFGSNSSAVASSTPTKGYTLVYNGEGQCDLNSIDLATGVLTDLPAASSEAACAQDLAVAPNGTVYGLTGNRFFTGSVAPSIVDGLGGGELITYSADGTPSGLSLTIDDLPISGINDGSIAVDAAGTVYVIALNETTCTVDLPLSVGEFVTAPDGDAFNCLYSVNLTTGSLTQIGDAFAPNAPIWGLTSCADTMWMLTPGAVPTSFPHEPATLSIPWVSINPVTAELTEAGASTILLGYDCLATGNTVYALSSMSFGDASVSMDTADVATEHALGTVDPATGVFTPTVDLTTSVVLNNFSAFAVAPPAATPDPAVPVFTR